ncbi:alpha beta-hydrolase [Fusarium tjaetaba]|uniref:Alpha beta-hydrolase n=1 Tax=Fusarium tjaetaba TaxID=1567544 RepID=A0A8H5Q8W1_9HYPO|nr:alpha beta-hydrolase [Fusarium tjaetaba]KAF5609591.1 alpha beta-hydrolase [Fusarium tjaetaba]
MILAHQILEWADEYASSPIRNEYTEPMRAGVGWWQNTPVHELLILVGEAEVFRDDIEVFAKTVSDAGVRVTTVSCPRHIHIECILDVKAGLSPGLMAKSIWEWLGAQSQ